MNLDAIKTIIEIVKNKEDCDEDCKCLLCDIEKNLCCNSNLGLYMCFICNSKLCEECAIETSETYYCTDCYKEEIDNRFTINSMKRHLY